MFTGLKVSVKTPLLSGGCIIYAFGTIRPISCEIRTLYAGCLVDVFPLTGVSMLLIYFLWTYLIYFGVRSDLMFADPLLKYFLNSLSLPVPWSEIVSERRTIIYIFIA